jgi:hypothetical protein
MSIGSIYWQNSLRFQPDEPAADAVDWSLDDTDRTRDFTLAINWCHTFRRKRNVIKET